MYVLTKLDPTGIIYAYNGYLDGRDSVDWQDIRFNLPMQVMLFKSFEQARSTREQYGPCLEETIIVHISHLDDLEKNTGVYKAYTLDVRFKQFESSRFRADRATLDLPASLSLMRMTIIDWKPKTNYFLSDDLDREIDLLREDMLEGPALSGFIADLCTKFIYFTKGWPNQAEVDFREACGYWYSLSTTIVEN